MVLEIREHTVPWLSISITKPRSKGRSVKRVYSASSWVHYGVNIPCASIWDFAIETMPALNEAVTGLLTELDITYTS